MIGSGHSDWWRGFMGRIICLHGSGHCGHSGDVIGGELCHDACDWWRLDIKDALK